MIPEIICEAIAGAGLLAGLVSLGVNWRIRSAMRRDVESLREGLREEMERGAQESLRQIGCVREDLATSETNAQASFELLGDGRLGMPARARALRMLRSGMAAETTATEMGLARSEVRLLEKVSVLLSPRD